MSEDDRREAPGRRASDVAAEDLARLAALAGARVSALEDVGADVKALTVSVDRLGNVIEGLATKEEVVESEARQDRKRRLAILGMAAGVIALLLPVVASMIVLDEVREQGDLLIECTTPAAANPEARNHPCYERGQARTSAAVAQVNLSILDGLICARSVQTPDEIEECYLDRVEARTGVVLDLDN